MSNWKAIVGKAFSAEEFTAYVAGLDFRQWQPEFIVLHNTSEPTLKQWHAVSGAQHMVNLEGFYRDQQHWSAGPHLFIAPEAIYAFTPMTGPGVHSPSWNAISLGFEMVGEYDSDAFDSGEGAQVRDNAVAAIATLCMKLGLDSHTLRFHKEDPKTTHRDCPGKHVVKSDMIQRVHDEIVRRKSA